MQYSSGDGSLFKAAKIDSTMFNTHPRKSSRSQLPRPSQAFALELLEERKLMSTGPWVPFAQIMGQDQAFSAYPYLNGSNQDVAMIDRGVDYNHPQITPAKIAGGYNFRDSTYNIQDDYGHGTGVAGIIAANPYNYGGYNQGVATGTHLVVLKQESSANIKAALDWVIAYHAYYNIQVVNITDFISETTPNAYSPDQYQPELQTLYNLGIFLVSPVGNGETFGNPAGNQAPINLPAISPYVFGVGGSTLSDTMFADSRRGNGLDLLAPAESVTMTYYLKNTTAANAGLGFDQYDDNYTGTPVLANYAIGTSWASAYTAGTAALLKQINPAFTPAQITQILTSTGTPIADNENPSISWPRLNIMAALTKGFQMADDSFLGNNNFSTAASIPIKSGKGSLSNLKLVIGHPDFYSFTVTKTGKVNINLTDYAVKPFTVLFDANHNVIKQLAVDTIAGNTLTLAPGKYYVYLTSPSTLPGTYSVTVSGGSTSIAAVGAVRPAVVAASSGTAAPAVSFSSVPITLAATSSASNDVLNTQKDTSILA